MNFACGTQRWSSAGHYLYSYNLSSTVDEIYDLREEDAENLAPRPAHAKLREEMIRRLGAVLEADALARLLAQLPRRSLCGTAEERRPGQTDVSTEVIDRYRPASLTRTR